MIDLITIARQFGAGGAEIAAAVGSALGWRVLDRQILHAAAEQMHASAADLSVHDERALGTVERLVASFAYGPPSGVVDASYDLDPDDLARTVHAILRTAVAQTPLVVVGHGVQCLFATRPRTLHVRVIAPAEARAKRVAERESKALDVAREEVERRDRQRELYLRHHFGCGPDDAKLYSMQVNTARISIDAAVASILAVAKAG